MNMHTKVKQLGANIMWKQITIVSKRILDFMDCFGLSKVHNIFVFMLNPRFKDLSILVDYVGHYFAIEIIVPYDN
jgi:hypothetical protein